MESQKSHSNERVVVVAFDESEHSQEAYIWYINCLRREKDKVILIHCPEAGTGTQSPIIFSGVNSMDLDGSDDRTRFRNLLHIARDKTKAHGLVDKVRSWTANPGETIIHVAKEENAAMVVVGSRGTGLHRRHLHMGSVSEYVLHHSPVPVVIYRRDASR